MRTPEESELRLGGWAAFGAYFLWGILPIYWKWITGATAEEILAHRIIWSFVFMLLVLGVMKKMTLLKKDFTFLRKNRTKMAIMISASLVITVNWYMFIWAVDHDHVVQASLGYYINPLVSVLLGIVFLKEKLSLLQIVSFLLATVGVLIMTFHAGTFPWISLILAFSFGTYGLLKKKVHVRAMTGLTIETAFITPAALLYLLAFNTSPDRLLPLGDVRLLLLLLGTGIVTAVPLLLFAAGANRISLAMIGFLQYIAPTIMLFIGTLVYDEPFNADDLAAFVMIWISLVLFTGSRTKRLQRLEHKIIGKHLAH
ncbi:MAG TPA: EamA family transporter RarD [Bacillales bacterium]|nr:EamA family transporter RarD [Bacillales bacterium]